MSGHVVRWRRHTPSYWVYVALKRGGLLRTRVGALLLGISCLVIVYERQREDGTWERVA